jgi:hypothetical protein
MKLWTFGYHDDHSPSGQMREWHTSREAAVRRMRELDTEYADTSVGYFRDGTPVQRDVPTRKAELANWLTRYEP